MVSEPPNPTQASSTLKNSYLLRGESPVSLHFLNKYKHWLDQYEQIIDALADLPALEPMLAAINEKLDYTDALRTAVSAKEVVLRNIALQLPASNLSTPSLKSFGSMTSLSNLFSKKSLPSQAKASTSNPDNTPQRLLEVYNQENKALDTMKKMEEDTQASLNNLKEKLTQREKLTDLANQVTNDLFEGQTPDFPEEDEIERIYVKLQAKISNLQRKLTAIKPVQDDIQDLWINLSRAIKILGELHEKTGTDLITDHVFATGKTWEFFNSSLSEYEKCLETSQTKKDSALKLLSEGQQETALLRSADLASLRNIMSLISGRVWIIVFFSYFSPTGQRSLLLIFQLFNVNHKLTPSPISRLSRTQMPSRIKIAKCIEKFKRPLLTCQNALNITLAASDELNTQLRNLTDECDRCKHELDQTRKHILLRAIAVRRSQRGVHPLHPEFVPSHMRFQTTELDDISDSDSIVSGVGVASAQAAMAAAAAARTKMQILAQRSGITSYFNPNIFQEASPPREVDESEFELSSSMISQMEREHEEYQAAEAAAASIAASRTANIPSKFETSAYNNPRVSRHSSSTSNNYHGTATQLIRRNSSIYNHHYNPQVSRHSSSASNNYHGATTQLSRTNSSIYNQHYNPLSRSSSGTNSREAYSPVFQPFNRKDSFRGRDLAPKRQNSTRQHLRSVSMDARSQLDRQAMRTSVSSNQWTISTSAAFSIESNTQPPPPTAQPPKEVTTTAWTISSGAASPSSWISNTTQSMLDIPETFDSTSSVKTAELTYADFSNPQPATLPVRAYGESRPSFGSSGFDSEITSRPSFSTIDATSPLRTRGPSFGSNVDSGEHNRNDSNSGTAIKEWLEEEDSSFSPDIDSRWVEFVVVQTRDNGVAFESKVHDFDWGKERRPSKVEEVEEEEEIVEDLGEGFMEARRRSL
ncbi:hypothetical protein HK096_002521 [Nowakowskiella sp. JEL0078]|nr:hypothetical protein HK096_002521 [Nowakowskiella sp. JEL0078]